MASLPPLPPPASPGPHSAVLFSILAPPPVSPSPSLLSLPIFPSRSSRPSSPIPLSSSAFSFSLPHPPILLPSFPFYSSLLVLFIPSLLFSPIPIPPFGLSSSVPVPPCLLSFPRACWSRVLPLHSLGLAWRSSDLRATGDERRATGGVLGTCVEWASLPGSMRGLGWASAGMERPKLLL